MSEYMMIVGAYGFPLSLDPYSVKAMRTYLLFSFASEDSARRDFLAVSILDCASA